MLSIGTLLNNRYEIVDLLGGGGFANVYRATDHGLTRTVAVKLLLLDRLLHDQERVLAGQGVDSQRRREMLSEVQHEFLGRFRQEAQLVANLNHAHILPVFDYGQHGNEPYIVMPLVADGALRGLLRRGAPLPLERIGRYLEHAAAALDHAHRHGIIHRDLKPENLLVGDGDALLLADFGIARVTEDPAQLVLSQVLGTPHYMAPEQQRGQIGRANDIYALGCVLFELLTGTQPYRGSVDQVLVGHLQTPVPSLVERCRNEARTPGPHGAPIPEAILAALQPVIERALAKHPAARQASAGELLTEFLVATDRAARPPAVFVVAPDGSGTHRTLALAAAAAPPGTTILLRAALHRLGPGLRLDKPLELRGDGLDDTVITADSGDAVLRYAAPGRLVLRDLTFHWSGPPDARAEVVEVVGGQVQIERCRFTGAPANPDWWGCGLALRGDARGTVVGCRADNNQSGIAVMELAHPTLQGNSCHANRGYGLDYRDATGGSATRNNCTQNGLHGIAVAQQAAPLLDNNDCWENGGSGIAYSGFAGGRATGNRCTRNAFNGIEVGEQAAPTVDGNACTGNHYTGLGYFQTASGTAANNTCDANDDSGLYVAATANPALQNNRQTGNKGRNLNDQRRGWLR